VASKGVALFIRSLSLLVVSQSLKVTHFECKLYFDIPSTYGSLTNVLGDIADKHHSINVASDFRALAFYPEFLKISWNSLAAYSQTPEYQLYKGNLVKQAIHISKTMPYSVTVNRQTLEPIYPAASIAGIMGLVSMFRDFIPGLIIDCQYLTMLLASKSEIIYILVIKLYP